MYWYSRKMHRKFLIGDHYRPDNNVYKYWNHPIKTIRCHRSQVGILESTIWYSIKVLYKNWIYKECPQKSSALATILKLIATKNSKTIFTKTILYPYTGEGGKQYLWNFITHFSNIFNSLTPYKCNIVTNI
jgi:hypothetical protein